MIRPKFALILAFICFFSIEIISQFTWTIGDDQVYYYMGKLTAGKLEETQTPYVDFFFAHPPLQLALYAIAFKFIPYDFYALKIFFILLTVVNSYLLYILVKREFNEKMAMLASILMLFTPTMLFNASFEFGLTIGMTLFLSALITKDKTLRIILFLLCAFYRFHFLFLIFCDHQSWITC